jgi:hypothetical protein
MTKTRNAKPAATTAAAADLNVGMVANPRRTRI